MGCEIVAEELQYIGMKDCLGAKIFEGDVVELQLDAEDGEVDLTEITRYVIEYRVEQNGFVFKMLDVDDDRYGIIEKGVVEKCYRVIGDRFLNPELLKMT